MPSHPDSEEASANPCLLATNLAARSSCASQAEDNHTKIADELTA